MWYTTFFTSWWVQEQLGTQIKHSWGTCVTLTQTISLWSQTPTEAQTGLTHIWWRVILTPTALPGMSSAEGEVIPPVQDEVSDGGMPRTDNHCQTQRKLNWLLLLKHHFVKKLNSPHPNKDPLQVTLVKLVGREYIILVRINKNNIVQLKLNTIYSLWCCCKTHDWLSSV